MQLHPLLLRGVAAGDLLYGGDAVGAQDVLMVETVVLDQAVHHDGVPHLELVERLDLLVHPPDDLGAVGAGVIGEVDRKDARLFVPAGTPVDLEDVPPKTVTLPLSMFTPAISAGRPLGGLP